MKKTNELLIGVALMLCYMAFLSWLFCVSRIQNKCSVMEFRTLWPTLYLLAVYCVNYGLSGRGVSLSVFIGLQALFTAAGVFLLQRCILLAPGGMGTRILLAVVYAYSILASTFPVAMPVTPRSLTMGFEIVVSCAGLLLVFDHVMELLGVSAVLGMCLLAGGVTILAMIAIRVGRRDTPNTVSGTPAAGRLLIGVALGLTLGIAVLLATLASGGIERVSELAVLGIRQFFAALRAAGSFLLHLVERFLLWLSQFFEAVPDEPMSLEAVPQSEMEFTMEEVRVPLPGYLGYVLLAAGLALLGYMLYRFRRMRIAGRRVQVKRYTASAAKRENGLGEALRALLARAAAALRFRLDCLRGRRTAAGLLLWCERKVPRARARRESESGSRFLLRLSGEQEQPERQRALERLAELVERSFYSRESVTVPPELCRAVRKCRFI